jgi:glycosyltransferase involved in cell wall biosynthesis
MRVILWQNIMCHLQAAWIRELAAKEGVSVTLVVDRTMSRDRGALGWTVPGFGRTNIVVGPNEKEVRDLVQAPGPDAIHVLCGYRNVPLLAIARRELLMRHGRLGFLNEGANATGFKGMVRRAVYRAHCKWFWHRFDFILGMGSAGVEWFRGRGYSHVNLFPFVYVTERRSGDRASVGDPGSAPVKLVFAGQCVKRKGIDLALCALGQLRHLNWTLSVIGDGPVRPTLERLASRAGIGDRVFFLGVQANDTAVNNIASSDIMILPSRFDGWGAVGNEALMHGVPVICSDRCGASDLLRDPWRGQTFASGSVCGLRDALEKWILRGRLRQIERDRIRLWSQCIEGSAIAAYFLALMRHVYENAPRPLVPWQA